MKELTENLCMGNLCTGLFIETADTHQFLDPTSSHPYHCKKGSFEA